MYLEKKDKNMSKVYSKTYQIHSEIISDYERLYTALAGKYQKNKTQNYEFVKQVEQLQASLDKANSEKREVLEVAENIEKQMQVKLAEAERVRVEYRTQVEELTLRVKDLEQENNTLFEKIVKHAKDRTDKILDASPIRNKKNKMITEEIKREVGQSSLNFNTGVPTETINGGVFTLLNVGFAKKNEVVGPTNVRIVTLKQLKEIINEIYEGKERHDEKCRRTKLPLETMEQYMFTYLNQKYGLKNLIIEWAASIVNGVK